LFFLYHSTDSSGALFCYVSGDALCACRDVQQSTFLRDSNGQNKYFSYEACTTPPIAQCQQNKNGFNQNLGSGDTPFCPGGNRGTGGNNNLGGIIAKKTTNTGDRSADFGSSPGGNGVIA